MLSRGELKHLSELARLEFPAEEETKLLKDLDAILNHFEELKEVSTDNVEPMSGGTFSKNVFRGDETNGNRLPKDEAVEQFPEKDKGFLKIPPVFE